MYHALVHYPQIDTTFIEQFRNVYDPYSDMVQAHITFLFGIPDDIEMDQLEKHIQTILTAWASFPIQIKGIHKSWDHCLYLGIKNGHDLIIQLHDELYGGILTDFYRKDLPFDPHLGLGIFSKQTYNPKNPGKYDLDTDKYMKAIKEAEKNNKS